MPATAIPPICTWTACWKSPRWPWPRAKFPISSSARKLFLPSGSPVWQTQPVLLGLFPELNAPGGIQRASRHLAFVMSEYAASHKMEYRFLSLNDSQELHRMRILDREFIFTGADRGKLRFAVNALRA